MASNDDTPYGYQPQNAAKNKAFGNPDFAENAEEGLGDDGRKFGRFDLNEDGPDHLPWLETDDDDYDAPQADGRRLLGFSVLGIAALAAIVGAIWWTSHREPAASYVADGKTVAAPSQPYKVLPNDAGGKKFDGTGDSAFAVSEGQDRQAKLGETAAATAAAPAPGVLVPSVAVNNAAVPPVVPAVKPTASVAAAAPVKLPSAKAPTAAPAAPPHSTSSHSAAASQGAGHGGPVVQVGAYSNQSSAEAGWTRLVAKSSLLSGQRHQIVQGKADIGTVYRLQILAGDNGSAQSLCSKLKASGIACQVKN